LCKFDRKGMKMSNIRKFGKNSQRIASHVQ